MGLQELQAIREGRGKPKEKKKYVIPKISPKRAAKLKADKEAGGDSALDLWFEERRIEMIGKCAHCGSKSCKDNDEYYKFSICHILEKSHFKTVATHPLNFVELCFWSPSCHTNWDNGVLLTSDLNCFDTVVERFLILYPLLTKEEKARVPDIYLNYIDIP